MGYQSSLTTKVVGTYTKKVTIMVLTTNMVGILNGVLDTMVENLVKINIIHDNG